MSQLVDIIVSYLRYRIFAYHVQSYGVWNGHRIDISVSDTVMTRIFIYGSTVEIAHLLCTGISSSAYDLSNPSVDLERVLDQLIRDIKVRDFVANHAPATSS